MGDLSGKPLSRSRMKGERDRLLSSRRSNGLSLLSRLIGDLGLSIRSFLIAGDLPKGVRLPDGLRLGGGDGRRCRLRLLSLRLHVSPPPRGDLSLNGRKRSALLDLRRNGERPILGGDLPIRGGDLPGLGGDRPGLGGDLPSLGGDLPGLRGDLTGLGGDLPGLGGDLPGLGGERPILGGGERPGRPGDRPGT